MEENNQNSYQFQGQNPQDQSVPPPPPPQDSLMGVRTMESDLESLRQTGGESPQSQIINAPQLNIGSTPNSLPQQPQLDQQVSQTQEQVQPSESQLPESAPAQVQPAASSFSLKTILIIVGGVILAAAIGYGVYYLVSSLNKSPEVSLPSSQSQQGLPISQPTSTLPQENSSQNTNQESSTSLQEASTSSLSALEPIVHKSLISNPTKQETLVLNDFLLQSFEEAIATSSLEKLVAGSIKDLTFVDDKNNPVESKAVFEAYFAPQAIALSPLFERDFTSWLYYDKTGGAKLGMIFKLKKEVELSQAQLTVKDALESMASNISTFFVSNPPTPTNVEFKDGAVDEVPVRFLVYSSKQAAVFEYGWYTAGDSNYLIMATSYNQMLDILRRLKNTQ